MKHSASRRLLGHEILLAKTESNTLTNIMNHGDRASVRVEIAIVLLDSVGSVPHPPEDIGDQGERVTCSICSAATKQMRVSMLLITSGAEASRHLR